MAVLPAQTIRKLCDPKLPNPLISPFAERTEGCGMTWGLGPCTYDLRIKQRIVLMPLWKLPLYVVYRIIDWIYDAAVGPDGSDGFGVIGYKPVRWFEGYYCGFALASTVERVNFPHDICGTVLDKSSWARRGLAAQNTKFDPGFSGHPTLELSNHSLRTLVIEAGTPICQFKFERLEAPTEMPYAGRYQGQGDEPTPYKPAKSAWE